jgi:hypothetical protein
MTTVPDPSDYADFPNNVVLEMKQIWDLEPGVEGVFMRPLRPMDPNVCLSIVPLRWEPIADEIGSNADPVIGRYHYAVQVMIKHGEQEVGLAVHAVLSKRIRSMFYRSNAVRIALGHLRVDRDGIIERTGKWGVSSQRFMSNEMRGSFVYLSTMEFWLETETT